jgi:hypothetical protein
MQGFIDRLDRLFVHLSPPAWTPGRESSRRV